MINLIRVLTNILWPCAALLAVMATQPLALAILADLTP